MVLLVPGAGGVVGAGAVGAGGVVGAGGLVAGGCVGFGAGAAGVGVVAGGCVGLGVGAAGVGVVAGGCVGFGAGAGAAGVFFTFFTAWPRLIPLSTISVFNWANGTFWFRDAFTAAMNCPWLRNPALACSSVIPAGSMDARRAFCCGLREMRAEIAFGSGAGVVVAGGVVPLPGSVPVVVPVLLVEVPLALADGVVAAGVGAVADFFADALPESALPDTFDPAFVALPDLVLPDSVGDPLVLDDAVVVELFGPPFGACTLAFGPFDAWAAAGARIVRVGTDSANEITNG